jgi:hypothetical protein
LLARLVERIKARYDQDRADQWKEPLVVDIR